jgi:GNAT superfamily N-acetyltransferase
MEIRPPNKPNYPAIAELLSQALAETWDAERLAGLIMADPHFDPNLVLMAREKGEVLGFLSTVLSGETGWVKLIAVAPGRRLQGLGREMLERAEERLFGEGARRMRAGFSQPALFYPGVPEGASGLFSKLGYQVRPGGLLAKLNLDPKHGPKADPGKVKRLIQKLAPEWWSDAEERLSFAEPRLALSADAKALCIADPGLGIGPLFEDVAPEASIQEALAAALAQAGTNKVTDFRSPGWWAERFKLESVQPYFEFEKDLRGVFHA